MEDSYKKLKIKKRTLWVKIEINHFCTKEKMKKRSVCLFVGKCGNGVESKKRFSERSSEG
jgi:hypothetical protein